MSALSCIHSVGLQKEPQVHCHSRPTARHSGRFLEAHLGPQCTHHCNADQPSGKDEGMYICVLNNFRYVLSLGMSEYMINFFPLLYFQVKCTQYWPNHGSKNYGSVNVTLKSTVTYANYVVRTLGLKQVIP